MITATQKKATAAAKAVMGAGYHELMLQPYMAMTQALQLTQQNVTGLMALNRGFNDEMQALFRRSRDLALKLSAKAVERAQSSEPVVMSVAELNEVYDFAVSAIRKVGDATLAAQLKSVEMLTDHALTMLTASAEVKSATGTVGDQP